MMLLQKNFILTVTAAACVWAALADASLSAPAVTVEVDFSKVIRVSRTITTLQVVSNPILDRTFTGPDGKKFPNPIHKNAWAALAALEAEKVRYAAWYVYPQKGVAELHAPEEGKPTSWDFTEFMPMLEDFMDAVYGRNHSVVLNLGTQPCWLFGDANNKTQNCSYPANPDQSAFGWAHGSRRNLLDPTAGDMAAYYGRLLSYLVKGEFTDEHGVKHTGGPAYSKFTRANGHAFELFNEAQAEHGYNVYEYIHDYDVIIPEIIKAVGGPENAPAFVGIGGSSPPRAWVAPFLNRSNHAANVPPIDSISVHNYSFGKNRTDVDTFTTFFSDIRIFMKDLQKLMADRDASSFPDVKFDLNELGVVMPEDNSPKWDIDAGLPDMYWNAAGAMFAYVFATLAPLGVEVLGQSQLAGSPRIPEWGIPLPQYPSVSLIDWRTGYGNARYWVLKLLIEEFAPGDQLVSTGLSGVAAAAADDDKLSCLAALKPGGVHKLLLVNHMNAVQQVRLAGFAQGTEVSLKIVDATAVQRASSNGIRHSSMSKPDDFIALAPFAVVVASSGQTRTEQLVV